MVLARALLSLLLLAPLAAQTRAAPVARIALSQEEPPPGTRLEVEIAVDLQGLEARLGAYEARLTWDVGALEFAGLLEGASPLFAGPQTRTAPGELFFSSFNAEGAGGQVSLLKVRFDVIGRPGERSPIDLSFAVLDAAGTFISLLPDLEIEAALLKVGSEAPAGGQQAVARVLATPALLVPGDTLEAEIVVELAAAHARLGAYQARMNWDAAVLELLDFGPGSTPELSSLQTRAAPGELHFSAFSAQGATGRASLLKARLRAVGQPDQRSGLELSFAVLDQSGTFSSLLPGLQLLSAAVEVRPPPGGGDPPPPKEPVALLEATPRRLEFGSLVVGGQKELALLLHNRGDRVAELALSLDGGEFRTGSTAISLRPGDSLRVEVSFAPQSAGAKSATLRARSLDASIPALEVPLRARALSRPGLAVEPQSLDFGQVALGERGERVLLLRNREAVPLQTHFAVDSGEFQVRSTGAVMGPGDSLRIDVFFQPRIPGKKSATLAIRSGDPAIPGLQVALSALAASQPGLGLPFAAFAADPERGPAPLEVRFADRSTGQIERWQWDFGDGGASFERHPLHLYRRAGRYTVRLQVSGPQGSSTVAALVEVADPVAAPSEPDFDSNGQIDFGDFFLLAERFGSDASAPGWDPAFDLVADGRIDLEDFFRFADRFGQ